MIKNPTIIRDIDIRYAVPEEIIDIKKLADRYKQELGFIKRSALYESIKRNWVIVLSYEKSIIAFLEFRHRKDDYMTIYHFVIDKNFQRIGLGKLLLNTAIEEARANKKKYIQLKCPEDLSANYFFQKNEFKLISTKLGKKRKLNCYQKFII